MTSGFQSQLAEMEVTRQRMLERLQVEKELHIRKSLQLYEQKKMLAIVKQRCFMLKHKDAELCVKIFQKEEEMQAADKALAELYVKKRSLQSELSELERWQHERLSYYKQKKGMMVSHQAKLQEDISKLKAEVKKLRENFTELEAHLTQMQDPSSGVCSLDAEIRKEEQKKNDMLAQISAHEAQAAKKSIIRMGLEQRVQQTSKEVNNQKITLENQRVTIMELQSENQSLENRVLEAMQVRDRRKRFGFGNHARNKS